jgi:hypothetical protein
MRSFHLSKVDCGGLSRYCHSRWLKALIDLNAGASVLLQRLNRLACMSALILSHFRDSSASAVTPRQTGGAVPADIKTHAAPACICDNESLAWTTVVGTKQQTSLTALANNSPDHSPCDWQQKQSRTQP